MSARLVRPGRQPSSMNVRTLGGDVEDHGNSGVETGRGLAEGVRSARPIR